VQSDYNAQLSGRQRYKNIIFLQHIIVFSCSIQQQKLGWVIL